MFPRYNIEKIKFAVDNQTFQKAVELYEAKKIKNFQEDFKFFSATVVGTKPYRTVVSADNFNRGGCSCYLGENNILCKHMVALAIYAVLRGDKISEEDKGVIGEVKWSGNVGELNLEELALIKKDILLSIRYLKPYCGPSKTWDANQASLSEGCRRLTNIINHLPVSLQIAELIIKMLFKIDKKLSCGGVDDSNGIVGGFIEEVVELLKEFAKIDPKYIKAFKVFTNQKTGFGWEESLVKMYDENDKK